MKALSKITLIIAVVLVLLCLVSHAFAISDIRCSTCHNMTAEEIQKIVDETIGTQIDSFESILVQRSDVIAVYGSIPAKAKGVEAYEYWLQVSNISIAIAQDEILKEYLHEYGGPIIGQGTQCVCYISIMVLDEHADEFTEEDMLAIKAVVDKYATLEGIDNCPLVFFKGDMAQSYLTEEQLAVLWKSGFNGLRVYDGAENLKALAESLEPSSRPAGFSSAVFFNADSENHFNAALSDKTSFSLFYMMKSLFGSSDNKKPLQAGSVEYSNFSTNKVRPLVGGTMVATSTSAGTVGYAAKDVHNPASRGVVTAAHILHFEGEKELYQPRPMKGNASSIGFASKISKEADCAFIPTEAADVKAAIYTGEGHNYLLDVIGYEGALSSGYPLSKSGAVSGNTVGNYYGVRYNQTFTIKNGTINYTVDYVGVVKEGSNISFSVPGDSGGPVYITVNSTINGNQKEAAVLLGILEGGDGKGTVYYVPCTEIRDKAGVVPLTVNDH